jgi:uncharacterized protein with PQ loop repeat
VIEFLGYVASALVVISLAMTSVVRLRIISLIGGVLFAIYGFLIDSLPIAIVNVIVVVLNTFFLWKAFTDKEYFTLLEVRPESMYVSGLVDFYRDDIARFFPGFRLQPAGDQLAILTLRDMVPVGLFIGTPEGERTLRVLLDYVTPVHRDLKAARFLFGRNSRQVFDGFGYERLVSDGGSPAHNRYLERVGFTNTDGRYVREL